MRLAGPKATGRGGKYPVQMRCDVSIGIECCLLAAQLDNLSCYADGAVGEGVEVGGGYAGGGEGFSHCSDYEESLGIG